MARKARNEVEYDIERFGVNADGDVIDNDTDGLVVGSPQWRTAMMAKAAEYARINGVSVRRGSVAEAWKLQQQDAKTRKVARA